MASRGSLVCVAVLCAALSAAVVAGDGVEPLGSIVEASGQGEYLADAQGGRKLLTQSDSHHGHPGWVTPDGSVFAFQGNVLSGNTVQVKDKGGQQANSAAANNAQINDHSDGNGAIWQQNSVSKSGRKLLTGSTGHPVWIKDGSVFAFQGNLVSGNTVQVKDKGGQQANSAAANNAQINDHSDDNGAIWQQNSVSKSGRKLLTGSTGHPVWIKDGSVYAFQGNLGSGNTVQVKDKGGQQANSAAVNNAQINDHSDYNGAVQQQNSKDVFTGGL